MNIILSSDNLKRTVTISLAGWRGYIILLASVLGIAFAIYWGALRLAENWVADRDPRIAELVSAERERTEAERREILDEAIERLDSSATKIEIRMWRLAELGNLIAERIGLSEPVLIKPEEIPLPSEEAERATKAPPANLSSLDTRITTTRQKLDRLALIFDSFGVSAANRAMKNATLPQDEPPPIRGTYYRSSRFGTRKDPFTGRKAFHGGYDFSARTGTQIVSAADGIVTHAARLGNYGLAVQVYHGEQISTLYAHMSKFKVAEGDFVQRGETLGYVGSTGRSTGPHLHFEIRIADRPHSITAFKRKFKDRVALAEKQEPQ